MSSRRYQPRNPFTEFDCQLKVEEIKCTVDEAFEEALKDNNFDDWMCIYEALAKLSGTLHRESRRVANYAGKAKAKS